MSSEAAASCSTYELMRELAVRRVQFVARVPGFDGTVHTPPDSPDGSLGFSGADQVSLMGHIGATRVEIDAEALKGALDAQVPR